MFSFFLGNTADGNSALTAEGAGEQSYIPVIAAARQHFFNISAVNILREIDRITVNAAVTGCKDDLIARIKLLYPPKVAVVIMGGYDEVIFPRVAAVSAGR